MDKERPVPEFVTGCFMGFAYTLLMGVACGVGIALLSAPVPKESILFVRGVLPSGIVILIIIGAIFWIRKTIRAFRAERTYYGLGLLVFLLVPLLFFGACTMLKG